MNEITVKQLAHDVLHETLEGTPPMETVARLAQGVLGLSEELAESDAAVSRGEARLQRAIDYMNARPGEIPGVVAGVLVGICDGTYGESPSPGITDRERLDWMERRHAGASFDHGPDLWETDFCPDKAPTLRAAIDAAINLGRANPSPQKGSTDEG